MADFEVFLTTSATPIQRRDAVGAHGVARLGQIVRQLAVLADEVCVAARDDFARNFAL